MASRGPDWRGGVEHSMIPNSMLPLPRTHRPGVNPSWSPTRQVAPEGSDGIPLSDTPSLLPTVMPAHRRQMGGEGLETMQRRRLSFRHSLLQTGKPGGILLSHFHAAMHCEPSTPGLGVNAHICATLLRGPPKGIPSHPGT